MHHFIMHPLLVGSGYMPACQATRPEHADGTDMTGAATGAGIF